MNANPPFLKATGVCKRYSKTTVLDQLELSIESNTFYALLGDNGAGKSTLMRLLLGIETPCDGRLHLNGAESHALTPDDLRSIGYVSATQFLPRDKTILGLSKLQSAFYPKWDDGWLMEKAKELELPEKTALGKMSRGQAMKAKLLLALAHKPEVVLLDEPFDSLDVLVKDECIRILIDWMNTIGGSVLMSSHEIDEVEQLADRVGILRGGVLTHDESLSELLGRHRLISYRSEEKPNQVPANCILLQHAGRSGTFIDTQYVPDQSEQRYRETLSQATNLEVNPMSLKEVYIAVAREVRFKKQGAQS